MILEWRSLPFCTEILWDNIEDSWPHMKNHMNLRLLTVYDAVIQKIFIIRDYIRKIKIENV